MWNAEIERKFAEKYLHGLLQAKVVFRDPRRSRGRCFHVALVPLISFWKLNLKLNSKLFVFKIWEISVDFEASRAVNFWEWWRECCRDWVTESTEFWRAKSAKAEKPATELSDFTNTRVTVHGLVAELNLRFDYYSHLLSLSFFLFLF